MRILIPSAANTAGARSRNINNPIGTVTHSSFVGFQKTISIGLRRAFFTRYSRSWNASIRLFSRSRPVYPPSGRVLSLSVPGNTLAGVARLRCRNASTPESVPTPEIPNWSSCCWTRSANTALPSGITA